MIFVMTQRRETATNHISKNLSEIVLYCMHYDNLKEEINNVGEMLKETERLADNQAKMAN